MPEKRFNFTKAKIAALPTPTKRTLYMDARTRGLAVQVMPSGGKTFYFYRKVKGKPTQVPLGAFPDLSIEQARNKAHELNVDVLNDKDPAKSAGRTRGEQTFGDLFAWWFATFSKDRKKTADLDAMIGRKHLAGLMSCKISTITKTDLSQLHARIGREHGHHMANRAFDTVRVVYEKAITHDRFPGPNPAAAVERFKTQSRDRRLTAGEAPAFFKALDEEPNQDLKDYVLLSLYTGARQANILAMRWDQIDFTGRTWRIPETKNGLPQVIPLDQAEIEILNRRKAIHRASPWVFPSHGRTGHLVEPKRGWATFLKRAGIEDLRLHDLRRTLGSWMVDTGASLAVIGKTLGHQSPSATAIYARLSMQPIRDAKARAVEALHQAGAGEVLV